MRHPLLRILFALLIGAWLPLCCCQATALARTACGGLHTPQVQANSCCQGCDEEPRHGEDYATGEHESSLPGDCVSCPASQGTSGGAGLTVEAKLPTLEQKWNATASIALAVLFDLRQPDEATGPGHPLWWDDVASIKANRDALRWHCALII